MIQDTFNQQRQNDREDREKDREFDRQEKERDRAFFLRVK